MKKIMLIVISLFMVVGFVSTSIVTAKKSNNEEEYFSQKDVFLDGFENDKVLVVLSNEESKNLKEYTKEDFEGIDVDYVQDLTVNVVNLYKEFEKGNYSMIESQDDIRLRLDIDSFHQVLAVYLNDKTKENVLRTIELLKNKEEILSVEPDYKFDNKKTTSYNDPYGTLYDGFDEYQGNWAIEKISVPNMWDITKGNKKIKVGIIDGAIDMYHDDLTYNFSSLSRKFGNGYEEAFSSNNPDGHGTGIAGIVGAEVNNNIGIAGVCWDVSIVSLDIEKSDGSYDNTTIVPAISYATSKNIQVLNMSLDLGNTNAFKAAILNYPGILVCAAGNSGDNSDMNYPTMWNLDNVISVGASNKYDNKISDSNYDSTLVHLFAPGKKILSTYPSSLCINGSHEVTEHYDVGYHSFYATSIATPFVSGVAAAILSVNPKLSSLEVKRIILDNVDDVQQLHGLCSSGGRLNAYKAVRAATESTTFIDDVNGDGKDDMILVRKANGKYAFSVYNGQSTGYLSSPTTTTSTRNFSYDEEPFCGDFNGDGRTDILLHYAVNSYRHFSMFLGQSNGTFGSEISISSTRYHDELLYPYKAFVADHDGDGKDDFILIYENNSYNIGILVYKGKNTSSYLIDATSTYSSSVPYHSYEEKLAGDFNGDGKTDIVIHSKNSNDYRVLYTFASQGNGSFALGTLTSSKTIDIVNHPYKLLVGDQNHDGRDDLLVHYMDSSNCRAGLVYKGKQTSSYFYDATYIALSSSNTYVDTDLVYSGDFTGDMCSDILVEYGYNNYRQLLTYRGKTNGYYYSGVNQTTSNGYDLNTWPAHSYVGDINGDGIDDFIVKWKYAGYDEVSVHVYLGGYLENSSNIFSSAKTTHSSIPFYNE